MTGSAWLVEHFTLFRFALFLCCCSYWVIGYHWFKPKGRELTAAVMAVWVQFSLGTLVDIQFIRLGCWGYRTIPFSLAGVPLDLHVNWGLIWGFFLTWLYSRLRRYWSGPRFAILYLTIWTAFTLGFDTVMSKHLLFLAYASPYWWLADIIFLFLVQGVTLWVYHTILYPPAQPFLAVWYARVRSIFYVASLGYVFYGYLPKVVLSLTGQIEVRPLSGLQHPWVLAIAALPPFLLGAWAIWEFTGKGYGTPLPLDPPQILVTTGPYAFVRNPMQISGMLLAVLLAAYYPTLYMLVYVIDMALVSIVLFQLFEQRELEQSFAEQYERYKNAVRNWIPHLSHDTGRDSISN